MASVFALGFGSQLESAGLCGNSPCSRLSPSWPWNNLRLIRIPGTFRRPRSHWIFTCAAMLWRRSVSVTARSWCQYCCFFSAFSSSAVHCCAAENRYVHMLFLGWATHTGMRCHLSKRLSLVQPCELQGHHVADATPVKKSYESLKLQNTTTRRVAHHSGLTYT
ncbi:hypothetical protein F4604DRAFT_117423 [Suillus subluteus]|nr:hypothetical protein F4604DRAFT_117423 [Suillus subluteus]